VKEHDGWIEVTEPPSGVGTLFRVFLPLGADGGPARVSARAGSVGDSAATSALGGGASSAPPPDPAA
jgi:hypothetical protein